MSNYELLSCSLTPFWVYMHRLNKNILSWIIQKIRPYKDVFVINSKLLKLDKCKAYIRNNNKILILRHVIGKVIMNYTI